MLRARRWLVSMSAGALFVGLMVAVPGVAATGVESTSAISPSVGCAPSPPVLLTSTVAATGTTATLMAQINPHGAASRSNFEWGSTASLGHGTAKTALGSGCVAVALSAVIPGLTPGSRYYFRPIVESNEGNVYPAPTTFVAGEAAGPTPRPTPSPTPTPTPHPTVSPTPTPPSGGAPFPARLHAVNKAGSEYACAQGWGFFDGPTDNASIQAMLGWKINAVRLPLNESCWLGINGAPAPFSGSAYRAAIRAYVSELHAAGLDVILDLHWSASGTHLALAQDRMADRDHSPAFWASVAGTFKDDPMTAFDLYNEPHDVTWSVWKSGDATYAGMDHLIAAVRSTGARNWVIASGIEWGNDVRGWLAHRPNDPIGRTAAGTHVYNFNRCVTTACWNAELGPVVRVVPLFVTELGENDCHGTFVSSLFAWADTNGVSGYAPWAWNTSMSCGGGPGLIASNSGTPTAYGSGVRNWYTTH